MKAFRIILCVLLITFALGLLAYQYFIEQKLDSGDILKATAIIIGAIASVFRAKKSKVINKKAVYEKAYSKYIQNAFYEDPALERKFYEAVHDYNQDRFDSALKKLQKLRSECQRSTDLRAIEVFCGLCLNDMGLFSEAITHYEAANRIRPDGTLLSNIGVCHYRLGNFPQAKASYEQAISADPENAHAYHNMGSLHFQLGSYKQALSYCEKALEKDSKLQQALATAAMCCALTGDESGYKTYYRRAVAAGYDGGKIKAAIKNLDPTLS